MMKTDGSIMVINMMIKFFTKDKVFHIDYCYCEGYKFLKWNHKTHNVRIKDKLSCPTRNNMYPIDKDGWEHHNADESLF